ncbi:MAG: PAS domain S-box protein [Candidatus Lokiarchaeota archaeon]|nr:PAS domain S-box protein [Candidatus Lokiarchaeota archaeon]
MDEEISIMLPDHYHTLINSINEMFYVIDRDYNVILINKIMNDNLKKLNLDVEPIGKKIFDIFPFYTDQHRNEYESVFSTGKELETSEFTVINNIKYHTKIKKIPVFLKGEVKQIITIVNNISNQKEKEQKLLDFVVKTEKQNKELKILNKIIALGNESNNLQNFLENSFDIILEQIGFEKGSIYLHDTKSNQIKLVFHKNLPPDFIKAMKDLDLSSEPWNSIFKKEDPVIIEDFSTFNLKELETDIKTTLILPLQARGEFIGNFYFWSSHLDTYNQEQVDFLINIGKQISLIIKKFQVEGKLKEIEKKWNALITNSPDFILIVDRNYIMKFINRTFPPDLPEDFIGKSVLSFAAIDTRKTIKESIDIVFNYGTPYSLEMIRELPAYGQRWFQIKILPIKSEGQVIETILICTDVTENKIYQDKIKESEEKYRTILEQSILGIFILQDNKVKFTSRGMAKICEFSMEELNTWTVKNLTDYLHPDDKENVVQRMVRFQQLDPNITPQNTYRIFTKSGKIRWLNSFTNMIHYEGKPAMMVLALDATDQMEAKLKISESEEKYRTILEQSIVGIFIIQDNAVKFTSQGMSKINEFSIEELNSWTIKDFNDTLYPDDRERVLKRIAEFQQLDPNITPLNTFRIFTKSRKIKWINSYTNIIHYQEKPAMMVLAFDATEQMEAKLKILESEEKYKEAYNRVNFYKDLFTHDINNILQNILSSSELLLLYCKKFDFSENIKEKINVIINQIDRGAKLVENVHKLSNIEESEINLEPIELIQELKKAMINIQEGYAEKDIEYHLDSFEEAIDVTADKFLIDIFENILINAAKYNDNAIVVIEIKISRFYQDNDKFIKIEIIDNGRGIEDIKKQLIFKRTEQTEIIGSGMGLGLSLVKAIIQKYGGTIWIEDRIKGDYKKGSNFILLIPEVDKDS